MQLAAFVRQGCHAMPTDDRYSMLIGDMEQQEQDLLECLLRIDAGEPLDERAAALLDRLVQAGLVDSDGERLSLTYSGIQRCQSLQYRAAGDKAAGQVLDRRRADRDEDEDTP